MHQYHIGRYYVKLWTRLQELPSDLVFDYWADRAHLHFQVPFLDFWTAAGKKASSFEK